MQIQNDGVVRRFARSFWGKSTPFCTAFEPEYDNPLIYHFNTILPSSGNLMDISHEFSLRIFVIQA